jgi:hypothetical protein
MTRSAIVSFGSWQSVLPANASCSTASFSTPTSFLSSRCWRICPQGK